MKALSIKSRNLHKWLMRFIGIQMLIWTVTGLYMVSLDIHFIHGETLTDEKHTAFTLSNATYPIASLLERYPTATDIVLYKRLDTLAYRFKFANSKHWTVIDATEGEVLGLLTQSEAADIALRAVNTSATISSIILIDLAQATPAELSPRWRPVWQVKFDDLAGTTFYIQQATGQIVTRRHNYWRAFDWMWRLHIMDYDDGENVANPLLSLLSILAMLAIISGIILLFTRLFPTRSIRANNGGKCD